MATRERSRVKLTVRLPRTLLPWVRGEARRQGRSLNGTIVRILAHYRRRRVRIARAHADGVSPQ